MLDSTEVNKYFDSLDINNDGNLSFEEQCKIDPKKLDPIFSRIMYITRESDHSVNLDKLKQNVMSFCSTEETPEKIEIMFKFWDAYGNGRISIDDILTVLSHVLTFSEEEFNEVKNDIQKEWKEFDKNKDNFIDREQFCESQIVKCFIEFINTSGFAPSL